MSFASGSSKPNFHQAWSDMAARANIDKHLSGAHNPTSKDGGNSVPAKRKDDAPSFQIGSSVSKMSYASAANNARDKKENDSFGTSMKQSQSKGDGHQNLMDAQIEANPIVVPPHLRALVAQKKTTSSEVPPHLRPLKPASSDANPPHLQASQSQTTSKTGQISSTIESHSDGRWKNRSATSHEDIQSKNTRQETKLKVTGNAPPMNAGLGQKSVKSTFQYPCTYTECTAGFDSERRLRRHKKAEHDWCHICDIDFQDDVDLIQHRIDSTIAEEGKHIACLDCGDEFGCEAGRNRHMKIAHRQRQDLKCPGCGTLFDRGSRLVAHVWHNKCRDRSGLVSSDVMSKGRVHAALELEKQAKEEQDQRRFEEFEDVPTAQSSVAGGVPIDSILDGGDNASQGYSTVASVGDDRHEEDDDEENDALSVSAYGAVSDCGMSTAASDETEMPDYTHAFPSLADSRRMEENRVRQEKITHAFGNMHVDRPSGKRQMVPMPLDANISGVNSWSSLKEHDMQSNESTTVSKRMIPTDWDDFDFAQDVTGRYLCPFTRCTVSHEDKSTLKAHLISGFHIGTDHRCAKCLKVFKDPVSLVTHMESSSQRCNIRESQNFANLIYVVSGGFLDINGDDRGEYLEDGQVRLVAPTKAELAELHMERERNRQERLFSRRITFPRGNLID